jgi:methionyl-tRNA formyltransferase
MRRDDRSGIRLAAVQLGVALVGEGAAGVQALQLLVQRDHRVVAVFTDSGAGESMASVASLAASLGLPRREASEVREPHLATWLRDQQIDLLLNVHSLHIVDDAVLEAPALGAFNLHPGPLPGCAGLNVPSWALYEGAQHHGVTLHRMTPDVDAGDIAFVDTFELRPSDTGLSVFTQCVRRGARLVEQLVDLAEREEPIPARPQDLSERRWFSAGPPDDGDIDWDRPSQRVVDFVRACDYRPFPSPWGSPHCIAHGVDVAILSAKTVDGSADAPPGTVAHRADGGAALVAAADGWVQVDEIEVNGQPAAAADRLRDGERLHRRGPSDGE